VIANSTRLQYAAGSEADPLHGQFLTDIAGKPYLVEYEPDPDLRDTEQVPLSEPGGIAGFIEREVLPHVPDAWVTAGSQKIGYEISFTRYFYKPKQLRPLDEIEADIRALERETDGLLASILIEVQS
jgi:type I restriction enzyme M protein